MGTQEKGTECTRGREKEGQGIPKVADSGRSKEK